MWALMARVALAKIAAGDTDPFYASKISVGQYFLERILPDAGAHLTKLKTGSANMMSIPVEAF